MRAQLLATLIVVTASFDRVAAQTPPVIVSAWPTNQVIFPGATNVSFYAVAVGTAPLQYDWFFNGVKLENETNAVQIYANATNSTLQLNRAASKKQIPFSSVRAPGGVSSRLGSGRRESVSWRPSAQKNRATTVHAHPADPN